MSRHLPRAGVKRALAALDRDLPATGSAILIYHRVGAGTADELDVPVDRFQAQLQALEAHEVTSLDEALDRLDGGSLDPTVVLSFDDGFADVYDNAWPLLRARRLPFTVYLASAYMGTAMTWEGSTAKGPHGEGMTWSQLEEMLASGLCTIGNHTHTHVRPEFLSVEELDLCSATIEDRLGIRPRHFTYPWGVPVPMIEGDLAVRFRSSSTGLLGRNHPEVDRHRLHRIPVRQSDPLSFFRAKLTGGLRAERAYARVVDGVKSLMRGVHHSAG